MNIIYKPIDWYVEKLKNKECFSFGMYGDGEWGFILGSLRETQHGCPCPDGIKESLLFNSPNYYFSVAEVLKNAAWTGIGEDRMQKVLDELKLDIEFHEKDMWDTEMKKGGLTSLIEQLRKMDVYLIGNQMLEGLTFLNPQKIFGLDFPDWYTGEKMDVMVEKILAFGKPGVYMIAGGPASCILTQRLHGKIPDSWVLHLGSIWDGFVGMGSMRGFRGEMYADPTKHKAWAMSNLKGIVEDWPFPTKFNP